MIETESTLTDRYQTTVPEIVRKALHLNKRDKVRYIIQKDNSVLISRVETKEESDPVVEKFLSFLAKEMQKHPQHVRPLNNKLYQRIESLISGVEFDLDQPLSDEDE